MDLLSVCKKCGASYAKTKSHRNWCRPCRNAYERTRKAEKEGTPVAQPRAFCTGDERTKDKARKARYYSKPENRAKRALSVRLRSQSPIYKFKNRARWITKDALKRGILTKAPCEVCGEVKSEIHHDDYSKPLEIRWLCREHHVQFHRSQKARKLEKER